MSKNDFCSASSPLPETSRQLILVVGESWDSYQAQLYLCDHKNKGWQAVRDFPAVCGQNGMAWGLGIYPANPGQQPSPAKKEGDRKSPAGIFDFGICLGYDTELAVNPKIDYQQITTDLEGVDDPASRYYNQVVDHARLAADGSCDWNSHEVMRREDDLYKWLIVINHNTAALRGAGSLIFMHVWENAHTGTAGCTALAETDLLRVLGWLDPDREPVLVQLPRAVFAEKQPEWGLPVV